MGEYSFVCTQGVDLVLKEDAFTPEFLKEFAETICEYSIKDHAEHIAQLVARGIVDPLFFSSQFIEGYGHLGEFVQSIHVSGVEVEESL